jgi:histidinol phosphatase-like enzyme
MCIHTCIFMDKSLMYLLFCMSFHESTCICINTEICLYMYTSFNLRIHIHMWIGDKERDLGIPLTFAFDRNHPVPQSKFQLVCVYMWI